MLWETFNYELACAELCGKGHWSMRRQVRIVSPEEYEAWKKEQKSYYLSSIYQTDGDPWPIDGQLPNIVSGARKQEFTDLFEAAQSAASPADRTLVLKYVTFETGSAQLTELSKRYELANVVEAMQANPELIIELAGHTDNTGEAAANQVLSQQRADAVLAYLTEKGIPTNRLKAVGYGQSSPIEDNATEAGRAKNRRIEFTVLAGGKMAAVAAPMVTEAAAPATK
jgi:cytochrome c oxidase subunit II